MVPALAVEADATAPVPAVAATSACLEEGPVNQAAEPTPDDLVEVWRPKPMVRRRNPRASARERSPAATSEPRHGESPPTAREETSDEVRSRRRRPAPRSPPSPSQVTAEPISERAPRRSEAGRGFGRRAERPSRTEGTGGRRGEPNNRGEAQQRAGRELRQEAAPTPPPRREAPIDLNSPFAKLLALKLQLEGKAKGD